MTRHLWPVFVLLLLAGCGHDDPAAPKPPDPPDLTTNVVESWDYLNNRFFRLDLPPDTADVFGYRHPDNPGRAPSHRIDLNSIRIYRWVGGGLAEPEDVMYIAATVDSSGVWNEDGAIDSLPVDAWTPGQLWRSVEFNVRLTDTNVLIAVDLQREMAHDDMLAVVYDVVDASGNLQYRVGENPDLDFPAFFIQDQPHFRMKLIKPWVPDDFTFQYVLRNIYSLGSANFGPESFDLRIERNTTQLAPDLHYTGDSDGAPADSNGVDYLRVFGLDVQDTQGVAGADGLVDKHDWNRFDLIRGLLMFPLDFPFPFAADREQYADYADLPAHQAFPWDDTFLAENLTPQIYDRQTLPVQYPNYAKFRLVVTYDASPEDRR